nr:nucleolin [Tanacetum cinerariifolium]
GGGGCWGSCRRGDWGKDDLTVVVRESICVKAAIMNYSAIKLPRTPQQDMTNIHQDDITPQLLTEDAWRGGTTFKYLYPRVYALESSKNIDVASKMEHCNLGYSLRRDPRGGVEKAQFDLMLEKVEDVVSKTRWIKAMPIKPLYVDELENLLDDFMLCLNIEIDDGSIEEKYVDEIDWNLLDVPPSGSVKEELQWKAWKNFLAFEKQSRHCTDYEMGGRSSLYGDAYTNRLGRSNIEYGSSRSSMSDQDSHASYSGSEPGGMYSSSSYDGDSISRDSDVGGSSYSSSMYSGRSMSGSGYMGSGSSGSYY